MDFLSELLEGETMGGGRTGGRVGQDGRKGGQDAGVGGQGGGKAGQDRRWVTEGGRGDGTA